MLFSLNNLKQITIKQLSGLGLIAVLCYLIWNKFLNIYVPYIADKRTNLYMTNQTQLKTFSKKSWAYKRFYRFGTLGKKFNNPRYIWTASEIVSAFGYTEDAREARKIKEGFIIVLKAEKNHE